MWCTKTHKCSKTEVAGKSTKQLESSVQTSLGAVYLWQTSLTNRQEQNLPFRKSAATGSVMSTCGERSLYTLLCSPSGRKFNIFWSTKSDWYKRMLCHVQQYNLTQPHAFSPLSTAQMQPVWPRCLRQRSPVNVQMDLGQNRTLRLFYPRITTYLQKSEWVPEAALQFRSIQAGEETLVPQDYNMMRSEKFFLKACHKRGRAPPNMLPLSSRLNIWQNQLDLQVTQCSSTHISRLRGSTKTSAQICSLQTYIQVTVCLNLPSHRASLVLHDWHQMKRRMFLRGQAEISAPEN